MTDYATLVASMKHSLTPAQHRARTALEDHRFFKLICGGSFTETDKVSQLTAIYAKAGCHAIDIAPDEAVLQAVATGLTSLPNEMPHPLIMVSIPLDPDPHFRKIDLQEPDCILCNACIPICPTNAIELSSDKARLNIIQPLCYGCGRCVTTCPTQALILRPFHQNPEKLNRLLSHPLVGAVEIHTRFADPYMLSDFLKPFQLALKKKALSVCFRPDTVKPAQWLSFLTQIQSFAQTISPDFPLIIQIDGAPMSGSDQADTSLPVLRAAMAFKAQTQDQFPFITLSGGVNAQTADYLNQPQYQFIAGVGMGTVARQAVWHHLKPTEEGSLSPHAQHIAQRLITPFQHRKKSVIIKADQTAPIIPSGLGVTLNNPVK